MNVTVTLEVCSRSDGTQKLCCSKKTKKKTKSPTHTDKPKHSVTVFRNTDLKHQEKVAAETHVVIAT